MALTSARGRFAGRSGASIKHRKPKRTESLSRIGQSGACRIRDHDDERRGSGRFGTAEIDLYSLVAGPAGESWRTGAGLSVPRRRL